MPELTRTISTIQAAQRLGVSRATVVRLIQIGQLRAEKKTLGRNSPYNVDVESLLAFQAKRERR